MSKRTEDGVLDLSSQPRSKVPKGDKDKDSVDARRVCGTEPPLTQSLSRPPLKDKELDHARDVHVSKAGSSYQADCYKMDSKVRGLAIIFNNKTFQSPYMLTRNGTDTDAKNLTTLFKDMEFTPQLHNDCTVENMKRILEETTKDDYHWSADCFACVILSHGDEGGVVHGTDGPIELDDLLEPFKGCPSLAQKPKLFFVQACRGDKLDHGMDVPDSRAEEEMESITIQRIPVEADFLIAYSCVPGYYAWRNSEKGSWFIQALVAVLEANWRRMDLLTMMTRVSRSVAYDFESSVVTKPKFHCKKQVPCITSMLTRDLYFTPKS